MNFPHFYILRASAGAGKTFELTKRLSQFLIFPEIERSQLKNVLAITFSNMATKEMKERTLLWLKGLALEDSKTIELFSDTLENVNDTIFKKKNIFDSKKISSLANGLLSQILVHYNDLQIKTIDSFTASIFSSCALDFGYYGDFDILMNNERFLKRSFDIFLNQRIVDKSIDDRILDTIEEIISNSTSSGFFKWDIKNEITKYFLEIYKLITSTGIELYEDIKDTNEIIKNIRERYQKIDRLIDSYGLVRSPRSGFLKLKKIIENENWNDLITLPVKLCPVNKHKNKCHEYEEVEREWKELVSYIGEFSLAYSRNYYTKFVSLFNDFKKLLEDEKIKESVIFIEDINKLLSDRITKDNPPEIYFLLGETVYHYFIDEFQDTSPIQWQCLKPLLENALSNGGSVLIVGDTKQAIYGFRNADWLIMKGLIDLKETFDSTNTLVYELDENFRSCRNILEFNEKVFKKNLYLDDEFGEIGKKIGHTTYNQKPRENNNSGYVYCELIEKNDESDLKDSIFLKLREIISDLLSRNFTYKDIAILTKKNNDVVEVAQWLVSNNIPAISYSSLDIRKRPIIIDIISLLSFLNSPLSNIDFVAFLQSEIFLKNSGISISQIRNFLFQNREESHLYVAFRREFGDIWNNFFEDIFSRVGYLPIYDLICNIYQTFNLLEYFPEDAASLIRLLEVIKDFEGNQFNNLTAFLKEIEESEEDIWDIRFPENLDAIKIMTIHKSKGLGFPAVIALIYEDSSKNDSLWIPREGEKRLVKITANLSEKADLLKKWYKEKKDFNKANALNSLYVCLTRAKNELYVIGIKKNKKLSFPLTLIPFEVKEMGEKSKLKDDDKKSVEIMPLYIKSNNEPRYLLEYQRYINTKETKRGDLIHAVLKSIKFYDNNTASIIKEEIERLKKLNPFDFDIKADEIINFIKRPEILQFFKKRDDREVFNELEFVNKRGDLLRFDRLIIDKREVIVVDFKTGEERNEHYLRQLKEYLEVAKDIWIDKDIRGFIIYFDSQEVSEVLL